MTQTEKAEKISITLPPEMLATIKSKVQSGAYGSTSEVIREAMRAWQREEEAHDARLALIRQRLEHSVASGTPLPLAEAFAQIEQRHQQRLSTSNNDPL